MLVLYVIVAAAVITVTWSRWEKVPTGILRMCAMLSIALGVRAVALMTALLLVPAFPSLVGADEPTATNEAVEATAAEPAADTPATDAPETESAASTASDPAATEAVESAATEPAATDPAPAAPEPAPAATEPAPAAVEPAAAPVAPSTPAVTVETTSSDKDAKTPAEPAQPAEPSATPAVAPEASNKDKEPDTAEVKEVAADVAAAEIEPTKDSKKAEATGSPSTTTAAVKTVEVLNSSDTVAPGEDGAPPAPKELQGALAEVETPQTAPAEEDKVVSTAMSREPVKFITNVNYLTPNRPDWLEMPPTYDNAKDAFLVAVKAGPYRSVRDCEPDLEKEVSLAVSDFVNRQVKAPYASTLITYTLEDLRRKKVVREQFSEQLGTSLGLMNQVHAQLVFDNKFRDEVEHRWSEITAKSRLAQTGLGAGVVLLLLSTLFSYFKVDTATKGYYTGRLQFATAGAILALVAASVLLAKCIPWM